MAITLCLLFSLHCLLSALFLAEGWPVFVSACWPTGRLPVTLFSCWPPGHLPLVLSSLWPLAGGHRNEVLDFVWLAAGAVVELCHLQEVLDFEGPSARADWCPGHLEGPQHFFWPPSAGAAGPVLDFPWCCAGAVVRKVLLHLLGWNFPSCCSGILQVPPVWSPACPAI